MNDKEGFVIVEYINGVESLLYYKGDLCIFQTIKEAQEFLKSNKIHTYGVIRDIRYVADNILKSQIMKVDCTITENYFKERERMCKHYGTKCDRCPLGNNNNGMNMYCGGFDRKYPKKAIAIVQEWSNKHPFKTYKQDFFEKFPEALKTETGYPQINPKFVYGDIFVDTGGLEEIWDSPLHRFKAGGKND